ncbi:MAG: amidohydrolase family protein [Thermomicrobiales bacterium]|nr:amidohydrolase family protein [Thermomicrobiales bacterium]MCO5220952.1 amidohydrolase family protein [Thermomicrobiales bacterium]
MTLDPSRPRATSLLIDEGRIVALDAGATVSPETSLVDLGGKTVLPAFGDCHTHFTFTGCQVIDCSLIDCRSTAALQEQVDDAASTYAGPVIRGWQLNDALFTDRRPTRVDLDAVVPDRPVLLSRVGNGAALLNSAAMTAIGIDTRVPTVELQDGVPTGWVWGEANHRALEFAVQSLDEREIADAAAATASLALQEGSTTLHAIEGSFAGQALGHRDRANDWLDRLTPALSSLPIDVVLLDSQLDSPADLRRIARNGHRVAGGDLFFDGVLGAAYIPGMARAALDAPYLDGDRGVGQLFLDDETAECFLRTAAEEGVSLAAHAVGERAVAQFLDRWEAVLADLPEARALRPRIDHGILVRPDDIARAGELGVVFSMQPVFETRSGGPDGQYAARVGTERAARTHQFRSLRNAGVVIAGGSDSPLNPIAPLEGIRAAVNHSVEDERLSPLEAIEVFTTGIAYAGFQEEDHGALKPGYVANLVVLDVDPTDRDLLSRCRVEETWYRGRQVYRSNA